MCACGVIAATRAAMLRALFAGTFEIGISKSVVIPPAAAAAVPDSKSSRAATPGCRVWTCVSMSPGSTCRPVGVDHLAGWRARRGIEHRGHAPVADGDRRRRNDALPATTVPLTITVSKDSAHRATR